MQRDSKNRIWPFTESAGVVIGSSLAIGALALLLCGLPTDQPQSWLSSKYSKLMPDSVPGQLVVQLTDHCNNDVMNAELQKLGLKLVGQTSADGLSFELLQTTRAEPVYTFLQSMSQLERDTDDFAHVQLNLTYSLADKWPASGNPNDPGLEKQLQVGVHEVVEGQHLLYKHDHTMPIKGAVTVGVIDTGVEAGINEFVPGQVLKGRNVWTEGPGNKDSDPRRNFGHGTFIGTLIAAATDNDLNGMGFLPGAKIFPVDVFNGSSGTDTFHIIEAIQIVQAQKNIRFINLSVNGAPPHTLNSDPSYMSAAQNFSKKTNGCIFNAAGNSAARDSSDAKPWNVCIEAVDSNLKLASFSNYGPAIAFAGLGVDDGSTNRENKFITGSGTSFAAPSVCAVAAMLQYADPKASLEQIQDAMRKTAKAGPDKMPIPNAAKAIKLLTGP